jgi:hypothetical protein
MDFRQNWFQNRVRRGALPERLAALLHAMSGAAAIEMHAAGEVALLITASAV